jgi:5-methylcytosine-specific restriction endonuclease McrA
LRSLIKKIRKEPEKFPDYGKGNCLYCGKPLPEHRRKYCCDSHGNKYRIAVSEFEYLDWRIMRRRVLKRDNHECQDCGAEADEVHHKLPIYKGGEEFDPDNCISLCHSCHVKRHKGRCTDLETGRVKQSRLDNIKVRKFEQLSSNIRTD